MMNPETQKLQVALGFSDEELQANREGRLSQRQYEAIYRLFRNRVWQNVFFTAAVWLVFYFFALAIVGENFWQALAVLVIAGLSAIYLVMWINREWRKTEAELKSGKVNSIQGEINLASYHVHKMSGYGGHRRRELEYALDIGPRLTFKLTESQYYAFQHQETYIVYYVNQVERILSAEFVTEA